MTESNDRERELAKGITGFLAGANGPDNDDAEVIADLLASYRAELQEQHQRQLADAALTIGVLRDEVNRATEGSTAAHIREAEANVNRREAQLLIGKLLDVLVLKGHALTREELERACLLGGRYAEPFLSWRKD